MAKHALLFGIQDYPHLDGQNLAGPRNDIIEIGLLLMDRYAFPDDHVSAYIDTELDDGTELKGRVNRESVLEGFRDLEERVEKDDIVVVCYAGHGSRTVQNGQWIESLVPSDSGRPSPVGDDSENQDIFDLEVNDWIRKLNKKTSNLTLIFDCCHSGSVSRNPFVDVVREVPEDTRGSSASLSDEALLERAARLAESSARLLQDRRRALVLAACRAEEKAKEYRVSVDGDTYTHGVFSYFLSSALKDPAPGMTWRGLFESIAPRISTLFPSQHPQIEGPWDQTLFGTDECRPRSYLRVKEINPTQSRAEDTGAEDAGSEDGAVETRDVKRLVLAGGAAQGVSVGSRWTLCSATAQDPELEPEIAELEVESVAAGSSIARAVGAGAKPLEEGQRAFLRQMVMPTPLLRVALQIQDHSDLHEDRLRRKLEASPLIELAEADDSDNADVLVHGLAPRSQAGDDDPCPALGPLDKATWAAISKDGSAPVRSKAAKRGVISRWARSLEQVARYRGLLSIDSPRAGNPLSEKIEMRLQRYRDGGFGDIETEPGDGLSTFHWGEGLEVVISNHHDAEIWVSLLNFSCDFSINPLLPHELDPNHNPDGFRLKAGQELRLVQDYFSKFLQMDKGLTLSRPKGFPWAMATERDTARDQPEGLEHLRLMVTSAPASFEMLRQTSTRSDPGDTGHPLRELCRLYTYGSGTRSVDAGSPTESQLQWCVVSRSLIVRDPRQEPSP